MMPVVGKACRLFVILGLLLLSGCATAPFPPDSMNSGDRECLSRYTELDRAVEAADARDHGAHRPAGYPWLRSNRFLASFRNGLETDAEWRDWLGRLTRLDLKARRAEIANLSGEPPDGPLVEARLERLAACSERLNAMLLSDPDKREALLERVRVPDDYFTSHRWLGLYPLTRLFVLSGVDDLHESQLASLTSPPDSETDWHSWQAADARQTDRPTADFARDALGIPQAGQERLTRLFRRHSPVWRIEQLSHADRLGQPRWESEQRPVIDTSRPTEFRFTSFTRFKNRVRLQLNYMVWLPERPRDGFLDLLGGHIDGLMWRVTLNDAGEVIAGESVHVCGCYYMVFPGNGTAPRDTQPGGEPILVGPELPAYLETGQHPRLTRRGGDHYLIHVDATEAEPDTAMPTRAYDTLRSLPHPSGRRNLFGDYGLVPGSERRERFLLWTMGVPSPGAMRQPGRHAIAFTSRRHLDDPRVLEESLERVGKSPESNDTR